MLRVSILVVLLFSLMVPAANAAPRNDEARWATFFANDCRAFAKDAPATFPFLRRNRPRLNELTFALSPTPRRPNGRLQPQRYLCSVVWNAHKVIRAGRGGIFVRNCTYRGRLIYSSAHPVRPTLPNGHAWIEQCKQRSHGIRPRRPR